MAKSHAAARGRAVRVREDADDVLTASIFEVSNWTKKNRQLLVAAGVVLALGAAGLLYYWNYKSNLNDQAVAELERVQSVVGSADVDQTRNELAAFVERFAATPQADEARLLLAQLHLAQGSPEEAIVVLDGASGSAREPLGPQIGNLLARAYEQQGRFEEAEAEYMAIAADAPLGFQRREALVDAARVRSRLGNHAGAAELYRQVLGALEEADTDLRGLYEMRLAEEERLVTP